MKKLIAFIGTLLFVTTVFPQGNFSQKKVMKDLALVSVNNYTLSILKKLSTQIYSYNTITITTSGTTNDLGCNPTAAAIHAALGTASVFTDCPPGNVTISDGPVIISGCNYSQTRTWTATDACGGTATASRTVSWIVKGTAPFVSVSFGPDPGCNPTAAEIDAALGTATIINSCGNVILTEATGAVQISGCMRTQTRTWSATDECNNIANASRTISWTEDLVPPTLIVTGTTTNLGCNPTNAMINAALGNATANDNCGSVSILQSDGAIIANGCNRSQTRSWTVADECGNGFIGSRTVNWIVDITPPAFNPVANITQSPDPGMNTAVVNIILPTVISDCGGGQITGVRSDNLLLNDPYPLGQTTITWTVLDACGNVASVIQTITIGDTQSPVINLCPVAPTQCFTENSIYTIPVLIASDNWGIQSISYLITGATSREGGSNNASGSFNPGVSMIHWTVTDLAGNTATCATTVNIDKIDVVIPNAFAANITPAIGSPNTIYVGYGGSSITLSANATSSLEPNSFSYKWTIGSPGGVKIGAGPTITVNPTTTTTYFVSVKDENNCSQSSQVSKQIDVTDIRCASGKIWVCEMQKNGSFKTICISTAKVPDLPAGSYLGQCINSITRSIKMEGTKVQKNDLSIIASPNPSAGSFELRVFTTNTQQPILIRTIDMSGRIIDTKKNVAGQVLRLGKEYKPGVFIIEAIQGDQHAISKIVKIAN